MSKDVDNIVSLCKRRGFIYQSSDLYGGLQGVYDFGPLGVELKNNLKMAWWQAMVYSRDDIEGLDAAILTHRQVLQQSGHVDTFVDPMVDCKNCKLRFRADHVVDNTCSACGSTNLTQPRSFNLMFKTLVGPVVDEESYAFLRPETAQGIFTNFKNVIDSTARKLPFGIAQIGKAFRNEITPRNFIFRVREFEQMELEYFVEPGSDEHWHEFWIAERFRWWQEQGLEVSNLQLQRQKPEDLSHYSKATVDLLYKFPHGLEELEGIANRTDFDLGSHTKAQDSFNLQAKYTPNSHSTAKLAVLNLQTNKWVVPYVIEPSAGVERGVFAILHNSYCEETLEQGGTRVVLKLKPHLAPIKVAVIPLARNNEQIMACVRDIKNKLQALKIGRILVEDTGNIGKSYRRQDEIGTPLCVTVDFDTIGQNSTENLLHTITIRDRDLMRQQRMSIEALIDYVRSYYL